MEWQWSKLRYFTGTGEVLRKRTKTVNFVLSLIFNIKSFCLFNKNNSL